MALLFVWGLNRITQQHKVGNSRLSKALRGRKGKICGHTLEVLEEA